MRTNLRSALFLTTLTLAGCGPDSSFSPLSSSTHPSTDSGSACQSGYYEFQGTALNYDATGTAYVLTGGTTSPLTFFTTSATEKTKIETQIIPRGARGVVIVRGSYELRNGQCMINADSVHY